VFFLGYKIVFRSAAGSVSYVLALGLFSMAWLSVLLGYVVVTLATPGADPTLAHRLDFLCGGVGFEAATWLDSLIGWGTVLLLAFALISFVVFFFNVTSLNLGRFRRLGTDGDADEDAEIEAELAAEAAANSKPTAAGLAATARPERAMPAAGPALQLSNGDEDEAESENAPEFEPAPRMGAGVALSVGNNLAGGALAAAAATAAAPVAATGPAFSIEMPEPETVSPALASTIPTPLSLADLAEPGAARPKSDRRDLPDLTLVTPGRDDLDPNAGAAIAAVADEDEDALPPGNYDPTLDLARYQFPTLELLNDYGVAKAQVTKEELEANKDRIVETLGHYGIGIASIKATIGPTVTLYEIVPEVGVRISKIKSLEDDIALSLAALGIRIIAPIPGKGTIGIEVPNAKKEMVSIRSVLGSEKFARTEMDLPIAFGRTITNEVFVADLAKMPHLLMAGATGQGKSVGLNVILASLLYKRHPATLKFVLVDPKKWS